MSIHRHLTVLIGFLAAALAPAFAECIAARCVGALTLVQVFGHGVRLRRRARRGWAVAERLEILLRSLIAEALRSEHCGL